MKVKYSCVMDQHPRFVRQVLIWASSLLTYGGQDADSLVVHSVGECDPKCKGILQAWGIDTRIVQRFDARHPHSNKLTQLESESLDSADYVVMYDCDTAFCADISGWIRGDSVRARVASLRGLPPRRWQKLFEAAGLKLPVSRVKSLLTDEETLPNYCSGCYIIPQPIFNKLREAWPRWDRWLLERPDLIRPFFVFADQISFTMSCEELGLAVDHFPIELNFANHMARPPDVRANQRAQDSPYPPRGKFGICPLVLHYRHFNEEGFLRLTKMPSVNQQIHKINNLIRLAEQVNFDKASLMLLRERPIP